MQGGPVRNREEDREEDREGYCGADFEDGRPVSSIQVYHRYKGRKYHLDLPYIHLEDAESGRKVKERL